MRKVLMLPTPHQADNDNTNSIHQIVKKLERYLPQFGYELTENGHDAEFIAGHAGQTYTDIQVDVAHCHGLYPTAYPPLVEPWHAAANQSVLANLIRARKITVPSQWVGDILRRDMHVDPCVVPWAIDFEDWSPGENQGYVLWNKTRPDGICDPKPVFELASRVKGAQFVTTFGVDSNGVPVSPPQNVRIIGRQPYGTMRNTIRNAGIYLATTKETFGIGILEAMACGIPVLGYRHGNVTELVQHGVTGYLVAPDDFDGLAEGLNYCITHRKQLGENARKVAQGYTWESSAQDIAQVYDTISLKPTKVSVVIPCYNYGRFVAGCMESVYAQETNRELELIVVNDGSSDNTVQIVGETIEKHTPGKVTSVFLNIPNGGVAYARNMGVARATGDYIVCIDADDKLNSPLFVETLANAMDADRSLGIVFTGLQMMNAEGQPGAVSGWPSGFDYNAQLAGRNQVPTCCMFKREAWRRAGGYRGAYTPAEDADLWLRITSLGYAAKQVTEAGWFLYRLHGGSLSSPVREGKAQEPNWRGDKPYAEDKKYPFGAGGIIRPVRNYDRPKVSIIVPVSEYHVKYLPEALDSIEGQTERFWECIVVNDSGVNLPNLAPYPWCRVIDTGGHKGAGFARNLGVKNSRAPFVTFLDADDMFLPLFLEKTLSMYQRTGKYVYVDWYSVNKEGHLEVHQTPEFEPGDVFKQPIRHSINILIKREWFDKTSGFNEALPSWEDVDFFMQLARAGICGVRVPEPLFVYRYTTGQLRERGESIKSDLVTYFNNVYGEYIQGQKMCGCSQPGPGIKTQVSGAQAVQGLTATQKGIMRILYNGPTGNHEVVGPSSGKNYGRRAGGDTFYVFEQDHVVAPQTFVAIAEVFNEATKTEVPPPPEAV